MSEPSDIGQRKRGRRRGHALRRVTSGLKNTLEVMRLGRLTDHAGAPFDVVHREASYRLRRYAPAIPPGDRPALLLVPPLMLTAEVYDLAPDLSAVDFLTSRGVDVWVVDFGAPEREEHGMERTLDDHVRAVADAVERVRTATGRDVHLAGYSQGGMFAYQAAALLRSRGLASVITFGSPVDIHRSLPRVSQNVTARLVRGLRPVVSAPLRRIEGLPGFLTSTAFKLLSPKKELAQFVDFVSKLHDRQALEKREVRRRFLNGEGFVAWPGPALLKFLDEFIVHNRMMSGGFVIDGQAVSLADIRCPVLYFVGTRDEIARPAAIRAITRAAPGAEAHEARVRAGHFGLVVGSTSLSDTWPSVVEWLKWREGAGNRPRLLTPAPSQPEARDYEDAEVEDLAFEGPFDLELFTDAMRGAAAEAWNRLGHRFEDFGDTLDSLRFQLPRLAKLSLMHDGTRVSFAQKLTRQAERIGERTFFLWKGRAFTYADANARVDRVARGLYASGIERKERIGVIMNARPSFLSVVTALNRLGAVAVLISPALEDAALAEALQVGDVTRVIADPDTAPRVRERFRGEVLALGGGGPNRRLPDGVLDLEAIDPTAVVIPDAQPLDAGRAEELALVFVTAGHGLPARAANVTNRRWAISAMGAAAACTLSDSDTVYSCLPLHHPSGLIVSVGGSLVGGSRLALATRFEPETFWREIRHYGATVAFYAGEMSRRLVDAPRCIDERQTPLRMLAGSGMRKHLWDAAVHRFDVGVLEFYASTECQLVLANAAGHKVGAVGRALPGSAEARLVRFDFERGEMARDEHGVPVLAADGEPGLLLAGLRSTQPGAEAKSRVVRGLFERGDAWFVTGDLLRRDEDGDLWVVGRASEVLRTKAGLVFPRDVEDALYELPSISLAAVYSLANGATPEPRAALVARDGELDVRALSEHVAARLPAEARPRVVRVLASMPMTDGFRPIRPLLAREQDAALTTWRWNEANRRYE